MLLLRQIVEIEKALTSHAGSCSDQMDKKIRDEESEIWKKFTAGFMKDMTFEQRLQLFRCRRSWNALKCFSCFVCKLILDGLIS